MPPTRTMTAATLAALTLAAALTACDRGPDAKPAAAPATPAPAAPAQAPAPAPATQDAETAPPTNTKCPVSGEEIDLKDRKLIIADYNGKAYGLCCKDCANEFAKHPEKYVK